MCGTNDYELHFLFIDFECVIRSLNFHYGIGVLLLIDGLQIGSKLISHFMYFLFYSTILYNS